MRPLALSTRFHGEDRMPLTAGTRLGPYEIQAAIGAGGMGEVYRARDTRLGRTVAIKVLPAGAAASAERRRRFEQEARAVSALNHPHICVLFDIGCDGDTDFLVMEYLDGHSLGDLLARKGRMPVEQALAYGTEMAEALAAAHRAGTVHRDFKPDNVMITKSGVKLLDFGLARLTEPATGMRDTAPISGVGKVLGTVPYMAPEQVQGTPADARTDIFAFGAVLYEMLTGRRAFEGGSPASVIAAILEHDPPPVSSLQPLAPPAIDHLVRRCLSRDPETRWQNANDLAAEMRWLREVNGGAGPVAGVVARRGGVRRAAGLVAVGLSMALAGAGAMWLIRPPAERGALSRPSLDVGPAEELNAGGVNSSSLYTPGGSRTAFAWTPDGQALVFVGRRGGVQQLYVRRLDAAESRPLANTEGAQVPAVSADGKWVAFWARGAVWKVSIEGGPAMELATGNRWPPRGMAWDAGGLLYFGTEPEGVIWQVPAGEGAPSVVSTGGASDTKHSLPWPLPGGRALLYTERTRQYSWGDEEVIAFTLATGQRKTLLKDASDARYVPSGHLLFLRRGVLFAVPFDPERLEIHGAPVAVLKPVAQALNGGHAGDCTGAGQFAVAPTGTLAWVPDPGSLTPESQLATVDRAGHASTLPAPLRRYGGEVRLAPDRRHLAVTIKTTAEFGVWLFDLGRGTLTPLASGGEAYAPTWSPDGQRLVFSWLENRQRSLASQPADASVPAQALAPGRIFPASFTPDGRQLAALTRSAGDIVIATLADGQARVQPLLQTPHGERWPAFSPDGRWLAYGSNVSGRDEVYLRSFPGPGPEEQVSVEGGYSPAWSFGGKELLFLRRIAGPPVELDMMTVEFRAGPPMAIGRPRRLFAIDPTLNFSCSPVRCFDVTPDGQRFYAVQTPKPLPKPVVTHISLIVNWFEELKAKVPVPK